MANVSRSAPRWEGMKLGVDATTPAAALDAVAAAVKSFLNNHASEFTGEHLVAVNFAGDPMKVALCIWTEYAHPGADLGRTARARHGLYVAVGAAVQAAGESRGWTGTARGLQTWRDAGGRDRWSDRWVSILGWHTVTWLSHEMALKGQIGAGQTRV